VLAYERTLRKKGYKIIVGVDEAGRGPLAGPLVVAAVYLRSYSFKARIDDSKKLSPAQRHRAFLEIVDRSVFGVDVVNEGAIDAVRMAAAARLAVERAAHRLLSRIGRPRPTARNTIFLLDGALRLDLPYPSREIIGGDGKSLSIASASIVAKVVRDRIMDIYDRVYPQYGFCRHKGYGTRDHRERLARWGFSPLHRRTFCSRFVTS
jgi:ribonuclease HII